MKIWHESYEKLVILKSMAENNTKKNVTMAEVFDLVVTDMLANAKRGAVKFSAKGEPSSGINGS